MIGKDFNRWTVLSSGEDYIYPKSGKVSVRYNCVCACGKFGLVHSAHLKNGSSQSCGCLNVEISSTQGGMSKTRAYTSWSNMLRRCKGLGTRSQDTKYKELGITYQTSWDDFTTFFNDMGNCPDGYELERLDSLGNYCKENCCWADETTQATNRGKFSNNTSGCTGVAWSEQHQKWRVGIHVNKKRHEGGLYENFNDAVLARENLELKWLGYIKKGTNAKQTNNLHRDNISPTILQ